VAPTHQMAHNKHMHNQHRSVVRLHTHTCIQGHCIPVLRLHVFGVALSYAYAAVYYIWIEGDCAVGALVMHPPDIAFVLFSTGTLAGMLTCAFLLRCHCCCCLQVPL
jgi:hypothetical protein